MSSPAQIHSFFKPILFQSRVNPHAPAVVLKNHTFTYQHFCDHIEAVTRRLNAAAIAPESRVGVYVADHYVKWLGTIALARIGLVSVGLGSFPGELDFVRPDVVVSDTGPIT